VSCRRKSLLILLLALLSGLPVQAAERRVALVVGNAAYATLPALPNSRNDAEDVAKALGGLGFEVMRETDATLDDLRRALDRFTRAIGEAQVAVFYYSGHGVQVDNQNFLVPVDARVGTVEDVPRVALPYGEVAAAMSTRPRKLNLVILDACSDNRLETRDDRKIAGLARMPTPEGSVIALAADFNQLASAGWRRNSLYTEELLKQLTVPGLAVTEILTRTRRQIVAVSEGEQRPVYTAALSETLDLLGRPAKGGTVVIERGPGAAEPPRRAGEVFRLLESHLGHEVALHRTRQWLPTDEDVEVTRLDVDGVGGGDGCRRQDDHVLARLEVADGVARAAVAGEGEVELVRAVAAPSVDGAVEPQQVLASAALLHHATFEDVAAVFAPGGCCRPSEKTHRQGLDPVPDDAKAGGIRGISGRWFRSYTTVPAGYRCRWKEAIDALAIDSTGGCSRPGKAERVAGGGHVPSLRSFLSCCPVWPGSADGGCARAEPARARLSQLQGLGCRL
jgi:hypothetical protein